MEKSCGGKVGESGAAWKTRLGVGQGKLRTRASDIAGLEELLILYFVLRLFNLYSSNRDCIMSPLGGEFCTQSLALDGTIPLFGD